MITTKKWRQCLNLLALIEKMLYGFCAVRTESLMQLSLVLMLTCRAMTQTVRSQFSLREIFDGQSGTGTGHSPSTSAFPYQYNSTYDAYSSSSTRCSYQDKRATPGIFPLSNALWEFGEHWIEKNFHFLVWQDIETYSSVLVFSAEVNKYYRRNRQEIIGNFVKFTFL